MNGAAPKSPATGSQTRVQKNIKPNLDRERLELIQSSYTSKDVISRIVAAKTKVMMCAI